MPRQLFADSLAGRHPSPRSRWTVILSTLAHLVIIAAAVIVPLLATGSLPDIHTPLTAFMPVDIELPVVPAPGSPRQTAARSTAAPVEAPSTIDLTAEPSAAPVGPPDDAGFDVGPLGVPGGVPGLPAAAEPPDIAPPPPPPPARPVKVGGDVRAPQRLSAPPPVYPPIAQAAGVQGDVVLEAIIGMDGVVGDVRVLRSIPLLDRAAIEAVRTWRYKPTLLNGIPTAVIMTVTVSFRLQ